MQEDERLHELALFAGYGGFPLALRGVRGHRTVCYVERDAYAAATLVARMDEARLDQAPVWSDVCTFDGRPWRGRVDVITAGFPCQPFSLAGKQLGTDDDRWLWPDIARIVGDVEPRYVFLENVPGVVRAGLAEVLGDLARLGFDAEWGLLSAAAVGAPHRRERFWLLAHAGPADSGADVADTAGERRDEGHRPATRPGWRQPQDHRYPPAPGDYDGWAEWLAQGGPEPGIRRGADGPAPGWLTPYTSAETDSSPSALELPGTYSPNDCGRTDR